MTLSSHHTDVVSVQWLHHALYEADGMSDTHALVLLDASAFMPGVDRDPQQEMLHKRIKGAHFFDFNDALAAPDTDLPHMLPSAAQFAYEVGQLGITSQSHVVIYDTLGMFSAARGWWMFKTMGHHRVSVLDGGLPAWEAAGYALDSGTLAPVSPATFDAHVQADWVIDAEQLALCLDDPQVVVVDARPTARFLGTVKEPRVGVRSGHMPNAQSLPFATLLENGHFIALDVIKAKFDAISQPEQRLIFSCGSGITACILALAAHQIGRKKLTVYDGSWTEWGADLRYPVVK